MKSSICRLLCRWSAGILTALLLQSVVSAPAFAQADASGSPEPPETVKAGVYVSPPFVMRTDDGYTGMAIDLWNTLTEEPGIDTEFVEYPTFGDLVDAVSTGAVDVAVTNLTITEDRAEEIDFTHPWFDAGLQIMISNESPIGFRSVVEGLSSSGFTRTYAWIAGVILGATLLLTVFDRRFDPDFPKRWRDGMAESFYTVMSVATSGKPPSRAKLFGWIGRVWSALWLVCGVAVIAYFTASITSVMTTLSITDRIAGLSDLPGKTVGVLTGSTSEEFARGEGLRTQSYANIELATDALVQGQINAIVGDAPVLVYYAHQNPNRNLSVVGKIFEPDKYGFGLAFGSPFTRPLTVEVIGAEESGVIEDLRTTYFGTTQ